MMAILNYTTKISVDQTVSEIHKILAKAGANAIMNEYSPDGLISAVRFRIFLDEQEIFYTLPANVNGVTNALKKDRVYRDIPHAQQVAWRIVKDWIEAQMAIVNAQMAVLPEVFLPYAQTNNGQSVYQRLQTDGVKYLSITGPKE